MHLRVHAASQATCTHLRIFANRGLSKAFTLIGAILLIQIVACKQNSAEQGKDGQEPGAYVTFEVAFTDAPTDFYGAHAEVTIDGKLIYSVPYGETGSVFLSKGDYRIRVSAEGFEAVEKEVSVQNSPTPQLLHFDLRWKK